MVSMVIFPLAPTTTNAFAGEEKARPPGCVTPNSLVSMARTTQTGPDGLWADTHDRSGRREATMIPAKINRREDIHLSLPMCAIIISQLHQRTIK
jgi:hypothetical protein